jgi:dTDP-4-dehydrorhamnose 3,5-epimerase-like enzyme
MTFPRLEACKLLSIPRITDERGDIGVVEVGPTIPFAVKRMYYSYNTPNDVVRGGHAHKTLHQFMIAMAGSFDIVLDDGISKRKITLNTRECGLYICPMVWRDLSNFSSGAVCLVLASEIYDENDYIRSYAVFMDACNAQGK